MRTESRNITRPFLALAAGPLAVAVAFSAARAPAAATQPATLTARATSDLAPAANSAASSPALAPDIDPMVELRMAELVAERADFTAIRLDAAGVPQVRMDLHFGGDLPESREALRALVESFSFDESVESPTSQVDDSGNLADWRTVIVPATTPPVGELKANYFAPEQDLVITFWDMQGEHISCSMGWAVVFNGYHHTGTNVYFSYFYADAVMVAAQARRDRNTNPQLYLYRWNGSSWGSPHASSIQGSWMDVVRGFSSTCTSTAWLVRVYMANEGDYSCIASAFYAN